jgi:SNF2 family DNA or RNA helicase
MGQGRIPALPTIIICTASLAAQWREELRQWLAPNACNIFQYHGTELERKAFFAPGSPYMKAAEQSKHLERTVILVESPVSLNYYRSFSMYTYLAVVAYS